MKDKLKDIEKDIDCIEKNLQEKLLGKKVRNKVLGEGEITALKKERIEVKFEDNISKEFVFPDALLLNYLICEDQEVLCEQDKLKNILNQKKEIEENILDEERKLREIEMQQINNNNDLQNVIRIIPASDSFEFDIENNIYYCKTKNYRECGYIGLMKDNRMQAIGKIKKIITYKYKSDYEDSELLRTNEITEEEFQILKKARKNGEMLFKSDIFSQYHNYYFVEKFFETNFRRLNNYQMRNFQYLNLCKIIEKINLPSTEVIAELIRDKNWNDND